MPVITARLSKLFYERLGEQIANELVDWFNAVDATYRSDLRELNETNFARFEARMDQRFAAFLAQLKGEHFSVIDARFAAVEARLTNLEAAMQVLPARIQADLKTMEARLVKWMFLFWAGTALAGLLVR
ncbi:MAG: hypothetical protein ACRENU_01115 [Gemmatimonadaceae bacterium]